MQPAMNEHLTGLRCIQCGRLHPVADHPAGCEHCRDQGSAANLRCEYDDDRPRLSLTGARSLGEGGTPLFPLPAEVAGLDVWVKNEAANPTGSHKDRFSWGAVGRAAAAGYAGIAAASSGNAALSLAAYSAAYGLACEVAVTTDIPDALAGAVRDTGATLHVFDSAEQRWDFLRGRTGDPGTLVVTNYTRPVAGGSPFGIDAMRAIGWEIRSGLQRLPEHVVIPVSRGDLAYGVCLGLQQMARRHGESCPPVHLVEPFPRLAAVRAGAGVHDSFTGSAAGTPSIGGDSTTVQALRVLDDTGGSPVVLSSEVEEARIRLARMGILCEGTSATVLPAVEELRGRGVAAPGESIVVVLTSHPFNGL